MLQKLREHSSGWIAKIILAMLVFVFSFFGIESYFMSRADTSIAHVGDAQVSQQDFQDAINRLRRQAQNPQSPFYQQDFSDPDFRRQVLDRLINQQVLQQTNADLGITVSNDMVRQEIANIPAFQVNGKFDPANYQAVLRQQGMTPEGFQEQVRDNLAMQSIPQAVLSTTLVSKADVDAYLRISSQTRDIHYVDLPKPEIDPASVSDKDIQAYYEANQDQFMKPESVTIEYLEVKASEMTVDTHPDEAALRDRYEKEKSRFVVPEQRLVSHILIAVPANASPEQQKEALAKAQAIEKQLADGADFAELAEKESDDLGSKRQGGSLGWIEAGMTQQAFEEAAFKLTAGQVSQPVLSPEGYHIIKVGEIEAGHAKSFAEVRGELEQELLGSARERKYSEVAGRLVDLTFQSPNSLQPAADALDLKIKTAGPFTREGGSGIASNPDIVAAAFSAQVLDQGMSSDPVILDGNDTVVLRLAEHTAAVPKPLETVRDAVHKAIVNERLKAKATEQAAADLAKVRKAGTLDVLLESNDQLEIKQEQGVARTASSLPPAAMMELFKMPHPAEGSATWASVEVSDGHYMLLQLDAVHPGDPESVPAMQRQMVAASLEQMRGNAEVAAMLQMMREASDVKVNEAKLEDNRPR